jgi:hypothetical protein
MSIRDKKLSLCALAVGCMLSGQAFATVLAPGSGATPTPGLASFAGLTPVADEVNPFVATDAFSDVHFAGTLESEVFSTPGGTLDFAYHVTNLTGPDSILTVSVNSYSNFSTDVDYVAGTGSEAFDFANRLAFASGDTISLDYTVAPITPTTTADWILVATNATSFDNLGTTNVIDGGSGSVVSFEPAVPEPMSLSLILAGGSMLMARRPGRKH